MKRYRIVFAAATAAALILPFAPAFAASAAGGAAVSVGVDASVGADSTTSVSADAGMDADMTAHETSSDASDTGLEASSTGGLAAPATTAVTGSLMLTRSDAGASGGVVMTDAAAVLTDGDLDAYAHGILAADDHIRRIDSASTHVALTYDERGWLLGFIPTTVEATAAVNADGTDQVTYPWYRFLMATNKDDVQARVDTAVETGMNDGTINLSGSFSASAQARVLGSLRGAMQSAYDASATASTSASTSSSTGY